MYEMQYSKACCQIVKASEPLPATADWPLLFRQEAVYSNALLFHSQHKDSVTRALMLKINKQKWSTGVENARGGSTAVQEGNRREMWGSSAPCVPLRKPQQLQPRRAMHYNSKRNKMQRGGLFHTSLLVVIQKDKGHQSNTKKTNTFSEY